jgi:DNA repair protein RecO (recombination protein O)
MQHSFGYILNRRPFRDSSLLVDIFTEDYGRICCVARPAKKRGKVVKGNTEPFRYLHLQWIGKGEVQTLTEADERGRHSIPPSEMMLGLYLNELLLLLTRQHVAQVELFSAYKYTLHKLGDADINRQIMMRFEIYLLNCLGYPLEINQKHQASISSDFYRFSKDDGLIPDHPDDLIMGYNNAKKVLISTELLLALHDIQNMQESHWVELRNFLDKVFFVITPRTINSRRLLSL